MKRSRKARKVSQLVRLVEHSSLMRERLAAQHEHDRMVFSARENQLAGILDAISKGCLTLSHILVPRELLDNALKAGGIQVRVGDEYVGFKP